MLNTYLTMSIAIATGIESRRKRDWLVCCGTKEQRVPVSAEPQWGLRRSSTYSDRSSESVAKLHRSIETTDYDHDRADAHTESSAEDALSAAGQRGNGFLKLPASLEGPDDSVESVDDHDEKLKDDSSEHDPVQAGGMSFRDSGTIEGNAEKAQDSLSTEISTRTGLCRGCQRSTHCLDN